MSAASYWDVIYWTRFGQPRCDRGLYKRIQYTKPTRIVEFGLGDLTRAVRTIRLAQRFNGDAKTQYCGIDPFELRATDGLPLKQAHQKLAATGATVRLVPGNLHSALHRTANLLLDSDLLIIDPTISQEELQAVYHYFPRMVHENSQIARYDGSGAKVRLRWLKPSGFLETSARKAA